MADAILAEVLIVHPHDRRLARRDWQSSDAGFEQSDPFETEPIFVVVPKRATDRALTRLAERFNVPMGDLLEFRSRLYPETTVFEIQGRGMLPRFQPGDELEVEPLDRLEVDLEVVVRLKSGDCLLRQVNAWTDAQIEVVDCWRADRVTIDRDEIESIDRALGAWRPGSWTTDDGWYGRATADVPGWLRHKQIGRQFIGEDRSREPWSAAAQS